MEDDFEFATGDAGSADTVPVQCSSLRKNQNAMFKGRPCKIVEMSTSKTGKHGHAKVHLVGIDLFTGKKYEEMCPSTHNMNVPNVKRVDFTVIGEDDGFLSLMGEDATTRDDLRLPADPLGSEIKAALDDGKDIMVTVISACGEELVIGMKTNVQVEKAAAAAAA